MKNILTLSLALGTVCTVAALVLGFAELKTKDLRATAKRQGELAAVKKVLPEFDNDPLQDKTVLTVDDTEVAVMEARQNDSTIAYAVQALARGYGGKVEVLVGVKPDGRILHVVVLPGHQETPGLGTKATNRAKTAVITDFFSDNGNDTEKAKPPRDLAPNKYLNQYNSYNLLDKLRYRVKKDGGELDAVSGATISSRAVARAVSRAAAGFQKFKKRDELK
ncbi:MAG: RnfABCDGE type electron transport complex subunit G [Lentisphaeria bacterium]